MTLGDVPPPLSGLDFGREVEITDLVHEPPLKRRMTVQQAAENSPAEMSSHVVLHKAHNVAHIVPNVIAMNVNVCALKNVFSLKNVIKQNKKTTKQSKPITSSMSPPLREALGLSRSVGRRSDGVVGRGSTTLSERHGQILLPPLEGAAAPCMVTAGRERTLPVTYGCHGNDTLAPAVSVIAPRPVISTTVDNPLANCIHQWRQCGASPWVLRTIARGYKIQFARPPPTFEKVIFSQANGRAAKILRDEIVSLVNKKAVREVPLNQSRTGFYSRYFLVKKKGGGLRPILDLRALNKYLKQFRFRMLTAATLVRSLRQGDWFTSIDLKDAYFHVPIYPPHRKFLRFGFEGKVYEYMVLPFGMSLSPRVFVKCTQAAIAPLRQQGVRITTYIDDWLTISTSPQEALFHTEQVVNQLLSLGFTINYAKSIMVPTQVIDYIGISLDSRSCMARLSQDRVESFQRCVALFKTGRKVPFDTCLRMAGLMASAIALVRLGRLYMRPFQRWIRSLRIPTTRRHYPRVTVTVDCMLALRWWSNRATLTEGVPMGTILSRKVVTTDASMLGWGATLDGMAVRGTWDSSQRAAHINYLELMAVFLALRHFEPCISGRHVLVRTDNTTTMCYINKQGGLRSRVLHQLAHKLILWCDKHLLSVRACHVPGLLNAGADLLSRGPLRYADWSLHPEVAAQIWDRFGVPVIDLYASEENAKCPRFFSITGTSTMGLDALAHSWPRGLLYAFPPLTLILPTLDRVRAQRLQLILVAPAWGSWRSEITPLLCGLPWQLPLRRDLLTQAGFEIFHPQPGVLDLWVWPVRG